MSAAQISEMVEEPGGLAAALGGGDRGRTRRVYASLAPQGLDCGSLKPARVVSPGVIAASPLNTVNRLGNES